MNKRFGATTGAALLLAAGALLRPASTQPASAPQTTATVGKAAVSRSLGEGPWRASCQYWAPVRRPATDGATQGGDSFGSAAGAKQTAEQDPGPRGRIADDGTGSGCDDAIDRWGIPLTLPDGTQPEVTALIAAVPDPERGHLQLDFDRTLDALMQAASDNGYVGSYFWIPWRSSSAHDSQGTTALNEEIAQLTDVHKEPGLIVLKRDRAEANDPGASYRRVIYLFLVSATPTQGVDGEQLRRAFAYEGQLLSRPNTRLSLRDRDSEDPTQAKTHALEMDLLLFNYSGSAASLREGLHAALADSGGPPPQLSTHAVRLVSVSGATSTKLVGDLLDGWFGPTRIEFHSFQEDTSREEEQVTNLFQNESRSCDRIALLSEDGTVFGGTFSESSTPNTGLSNKTAGKPILTPCKGSVPLVLKFPRDISLLRNATAKKGATNKAATDDGISPYLRFSLEDSDAEDSIPHFSNDDTPLSQEAQLMAVGRRLAQLQVTTIAVSASNILDEIFLAQFLHRACPDARLIFLGGGDLLLEREIDNAQYVGAITISPYSLVTLDHDSNTPGRMRAFASAQSEAFYNAASFVFRDRNAVAPVLAGYPKRPDSDALRPLLWATTVGRDGYYPLGILSPCGSDRESTLPDVLPAKASSDAATQPCTEGSDGKPPRPFEPREHIAPSMVWFALSLFLLLLSLAHGSALSTASFWSSLTRDLAIRSGDMPRRRAVYINIASVMLVSMAFVVAYPLFPVLRYSERDGTALLCAVLLLVAASGTLILTLRKTLPYMHLRRRRGGVGERRDRCDAPVKGEIHPQPDVYAVLHGVAAMTLVVVPLLWVVLCESNRTVGTKTFAGLFFSYRCLYPESGVSPLPPVLMLLFAWYLWGLFQTLRLRFSINGRPQLPCAIPAASAYPLYVSDGQLSSCDSPQSSCLYRNITCLLITREIVRRFVWSRGKTLDGILIAGYFGLFVCTVMLVHVQSLDHFLWNAHRLPTFYEFLVRALLFPLMVIAVTGWVRVLFIWTSFRRSVLEPLERLPIRFAFTRLKGIAWMTMLRPGGLQEYWRDMARSTESLRQMVHNADMQQLIEPASPPLWTELRECYGTLEDHIRKLLHLTGNGGHVHTGSREYLVGGDIPHPNDRDELNLMAAIEHCYARGCELLLEGLLVPYWNQRRTGLVEGEGGAALPGKVGGESADAPESQESHDPSEAKGIVLAEEFLALRYVALIRAVLINLRYTMIFVSTAFALAILAWSSYPFRPRYWVDCMFTAILVVLGAGVVWVFAQMYRNPLLSRITDTSANELGVEFYLRLATFGAVPLLTWLATQFPAIGNSLYHYLQPGLEVMK